MMKTDNMEVWEKLKRINALADIGLIHGENAFDRERYEEIKQLTLDLMTDYTSGDRKMLESIFALPKDYPTAKVDVRALVLSEDGSQVLLVKEMADGRWSLPGGWADIGFSPTEVAVKECKEETGLDVNVSRLLAVYDKRKHAHPPQSFYVYKLIFKCKAASQELKKGFDVLDAAYFELKDLPPLSLDRILEEQIHELVQIAQQNLPVHYD